MPEREASAVESAALAGMRIVVTGAAQGIGASTLRAYVAAGADVAALDVNAEAGATEAAKAGAAGPGTACFRRCDVGSRSSVAEAFGAVADRFGGRLDVLAHVAGIERSVPAEDISDDEWDAVFDVNVKGTLYTNQSAFRLMRADGGTIINFTSGAALKPYPRGAHYSAAKAAVAAWTRTVAHEWGRYGIRVNSVAPAMRTPPCTSTRTGPTRSTRRRLSAIPGISPPRPFRPRWPSPSTSARAGPSSPPRYVSASTSPRASRCHRGPWTPRRTGAR
jgi:2-hydroxycyclohexanecarboxyl-CoA dehydrogenase